MKKYILIQSVSAVTGPEPVYQQNCDILMDKQSGKIDKIGENLTGSFSPGELENIYVDESFKGCLALPGFIDPHVHFRYPSPNVNTPLEAENWFSGSKAALFGGVTTVLEMPNTLPPTINETGLRIKLDHIKNKSLVNYGLYGGMTASNLPFLLETPEIKAVKVYLASTTGDLLLREFPDLKKTSSGKVFTFHAEDESIIQANRQNNGPLKKPIEHSQIRSETAAIEAVKWVVEIQKWTNLKFHIAHVSTPGEAEILNDAGMSFECAAHHIYVNWNAYDYGGYLWKCNPPIRSPQSAEKLRQYLREGKIPMMATDHAPHTPSSKSFDGQKEPASGLPSLEAASHFVLNDLSLNKITPAAAAQVLSSNAARLFNIEKRGFISEGYYADLAMVDLNCPWTFEQKHVQSLCGWSPFINYQFHARVTAAFVNGVAYKTDDLKNLDAPGNRMIHMV